MDRFGANYFEDLLGRLYADLRAIDTAGFRFEQSDRFTIATVPEQWTSHLESWVWLASSVDLTAPHLVFDGVLTFGCRFNSNETDGRSQAIAVAAALAAVNMLLSFRVTRGRIVRADVETIAPVDPNWLQVVIPFTLHLEH